MREIIAGFYWFVTATVDKIISTHANCTTSFMHTFANCYKHNTYLRCNKDIRDKLIIKNPENILELSFNSLSIEYINYYTVNKNIQSHGEL